MKIFLDTSSLFKLYHKEDGTENLELFFSTLKITNIFLSEISNMAGKLETITGMDAIREKNKGFQSMVEEMHGGYTKELTVFGNNIFMEMGMDATMKGMGRMNMNEMAHYEVKDGKIISERFYY